MHEYYILDIETTKDGIPKKTTLKDINENIKKDYKKKLIYTNDPEIRRELVCIFPYRLTIFYCKDFEPIKKGYFTKPEDYKKI